jgi:VWFA-related protein
MAFPRFARGGVLAAGVGLLLLGAPAPRIGAQQPGGVGPTFRSSVEYVEVDVVVTDAQGQFARNLTRDDFQLLEDGKRQEIASFSLIDIPVERYERPLFQSQPVEPDVRTNERPFDGRVYVMVIDDLHTNALRVQRTKAAARQFIEQRLGANDLMAVVHTAGPESASQDFTNSKPRLLAAVDKTMGHALESATAIANQNAVATRGNVSDDTSSMERAMNAQTTLGLVRDIASWFATVRGRRKSILLLTEGIDYDMSNVMDPRGGVVADAAREAIDAAMRANVSIYGIDPRGVTGIDDIGIEYANGPADPALGSRALYNQQRLEADSLRMLADETGGLAVVGTNNLARAYDAIVADNSSYYVLAYSSPNEKRDGKFHKIDVRVNRPGLIARARRGYVAPTGKAPLAPADAAAGPSPEVRDALRSPLPVSGLTMSVALAPFKGTAPNASVLFSAELRGTDLSLVDHNKLEFSFVAVDVKGKVRAGSNDTIELTALREETRAAIERSGLRVFNRLELAPGRYQVRVAAHDQGGGAAGSVTYDLDVPDFYKLPLSMSGMLITSLGGGAMVVAKADDQTKDLLPAPPVVERTFPQNDELALFADVYDNETAPHKVDVETTLTSDAGAVVFKTAEERSASELDGVRGGYGITARVPLSDVAPGRYVLAMRARSRLGDEPAAERQVEITVTPAAR